MGVGGHWDGQTHTACDKRDCSSLTGTLRHDISTHSGRCLVMRIGQHARVHE